MGIGQRIGTLLAQGMGLGSIQTPNEEVVLTVNGWEHQIEFVLPWVGFEGSIPNRYSRDPRYPGLNLMEGHAVKWMGNLARITLSYRTPDYPITDTSGVPPDEFQENPSAQVESIVLNPRFNDPTFYPPGNNALVGSDGQFTGFNAGTPDYGQNDFYQGCKTIVHTQYSQRLSSSLFNTSIEGAPEPDDYVVIATPPGYGGDNNYLRLTSEVNPAGLWWTKKNTYLYRQTAWSTNAYAQE